MKKIRFALLGIIGLAIFACNNSTNEKKSEPSQQAKADSLEKEVEDGHNVAMAKMMSIRSLKKEANRLIDSISRLPAKARQEAAPYEAKLKSLIAEFDKATEGMDTWMSNINFDSARNDVEQRIKYLAEEKLKVEVVKDAIANSLTKADSLLKTKL